MGYKIGVDDKIIKNLGTIGLKSLVFAVCTAGFSVLMTFLFFKLLGKLKKNKEEEC